MKRFARALWQTGWRHLLLLAVTLLSYLLQTCLFSDYVKIGGVTPNLMMATLAVIAVGYGRLQALWSGIILGVLLEVMQPTASLLNLLMYPISAFFTAAIFANKSDQTLAYEKSIGKAGRDIHPLFRVLMCAAVNITVYEVVNLAYTYLRGTDLTAAHFGRALLDILLTTLLSLPVLFLLRRPFGIRGLRQVQRAPPTQAHPTPSQASASTCSEARLHLMWLISAHHRHKSACMQHLADFSRCILGHMPPHTPSSPREEGISHRNSGSSESHAQQERPGALPPVHAGGGDDVCLPAPRPGGPAAKGERLLQ